MYCVRSVWKKCDKASTCTELGGYCLCYPEEYYSDDRHVKQDGACILPPGEDSTSIPHVDTQQPDHIKKPKKFIVRSGVVIVVHTFINLYLLLCINMWY